MRSLLPRVLCCALAVVLFTPALPVLPVAAQTDGPDASIVGEFGSGFRARLDAYAQIADLDFRDAKVLDALEQFADALGFVVGDGITDEQAFEDDAAGIMALVQSQSTPANVADAVGDALAEADRVAATVQLRLARARVNVAVDGDEDVSPSVFNHLEQAQAFLDKGADEAAKGAHAQAIRTYRSAWLAAAKALEALASDLDVDDDLLLDGIEAELGTDPDNADSDGDGLADIVELWTTFTDPTSPMTDGIDDATADPDGDGVGNLDELAAASDPLERDTDGDTLDDGAELFDIRTDPTRDDTDDDRLSDDSELRLGTDPLDPDSDGDGVLDGDEVYTSEASFPTGVGVSITGVGDVAKTVTLLDETGSPWLTDLPGLASPVVDIDADAPFSSATLEIPFDSNALPGGDLSGVGVMYYDEALGTWVPLDPGTTEVDAATGTVTATTDHFTLFAVFFIPGWQAVIDSWDPNAGSGGDTQFVDVALVLDSSGSMQGNDPNGLRRIASKSFIDALVPGDQVAVVDFDSFAQLLQPLTTDFEAARAAVDRVNSSGGTNIGAGVSVANNELINNGDPDHSRLQVLLTDGHGAYNSSLTQQAIDNGVTIYTIGLGSGVDDNLLRSIAESTGGQYFPVAEAEDLPDVFSRINLDPDGDFDHDGIRNGSELDGIVTGTGRTYRTNALDPDTDGDGLLDGEELVFSEFFYVAMSNPLDPDSDDDTLNDADEIEISLSPLSRDRDRDGVFDGVEVHAGFDPRDKNGDGDDFDDDDELDRGSDPYTFDLAGADQGRAFVAGALLGELGDNVPAFDTELRDLAGDLVELAPDVPYLSDALAGIADGVSDALSGLGCFGNDVLGVLNPIGGGPGDTICENLDFRIKYTPEYQKSMSYLGGWIAISSIPFVDIVASVRDLIGSLIDGEWVGAGLEVIFGVLGFFVPVIGDVVGRTIKFLRRTPEAAGAVFRFFVERWRSADEIFLPLVKQTWGMSDDQLARAGGVDGVIELGQESVNTTKLVRWLGRHADNTISRVSVSDDAVIDSVRRNWSAAGDEAAERTIRNLAAEAVSTEAAVRILESRGYDVLFTSRNVPLDLGDDVTRSVVNGPDIVARTPSGRPVIVEVKGSNADRLRISRSTITNSAGVQTSRPWLETGAGRRYLDTMREASLLDESLEGAVDIIDDILVNEVAYDVVVIGASKETAFGATLEDALLALDNGGSVEVVEIDVNEAVLDAAYEALRP